jgi:sialic acid synthase SpsE
MDLKKLKSVFIIAEIGQNHQGDIEKAKEVIKYIEFTDVLFTPKLIFIINFR